MPVESSAPVLGSVCVFCASSMGVDPAYRAAAERFGDILARNRVKLVYGGGGVGLMGACARAAHAAGGDILGVMPTFLQSREGAFEAAPTILVSTMHERKALMYARSDAFAVLPGGVGTLEEVVEVLSWRRLGLHRKPVVFLDPGDFWEPLFALVRHTVRAGLTPDWFLDTWRAVKTPEELLPAMRAMMAEAGGSAADAASLA